MGNKIEFGRLLTVGQAAERAAVSVHTIRAWVAQRKLGSVRLGRAVRVPQREVDAMVEDGFIPAGRTDRT